MTVDDPVVLKVAQRDVRGAGERGGGNELSYF